MNVIPLPNYYKERSGFFKIADTINFGESLEEIASYLIKFLESKTKFLFKKENYAAINLVLDYSLLEEEYHLKITEKELTLSAKSSRGIFYGIQTLKQLLTMVDGEWGFPALEIKDSPRFSYRGFMLDVVRHFFPKEEVFRLIDLISFHKFNYLHLHLSDDQGWRIEIEKYPLLNLIASQRKGTILKTKKIDNIPHQGLYSKNDLKEIVAYAKKRHIEVIPEIDMPGHMNAMLAAYPELLCTGVDKIEVRTHWGISPNILCAGNKLVYDMLENILLEVMEIFPSRFIHIGGDEAPKKNWKNCKLCQEKIKENNLKDEEELQVYFFNHFQKFLSSHNKIAIGWNEILHKNLNKGAVIQHWKPNTNRKTVKYLNLGQRTIISNFMYLYLDYPYAMTPLSKTYNFEPILKGIKKPDNIIGVETPLWTEWVQNRSKIDFQTFPRLAAVSEIAWTEKEHKDYDDFCRRLQALYHHYDELGINYARGMEKQPPLLKRIVETRKWWKDENVEIDKN